MSARLHHARITAPWFDDVINERVYGGSAVRAATAAQFSRVQLVNATGSGVWGYVILVTLGPGTANTTLRVGLAAAQSGAKVMDVKQLVDPAVTGQLDVFASSSASQLLAATDAQLTIPMAGAGQQPQLRLDQFPIIVKPGKVLTIEDTVVNQILTVGFIVVERPISN